MQLNALKRDHREWMYPKLGVVSLERTDLGALPHIRI